MPERFNISYHYIWDAINSCLQQQRQTENCWQNKNKTRDYHCSTISNLKSKSLLDVKFSIFVHLSMSRFTDDPVPVISNSNNCEWWHVDSHTGKTLDQSATNAMTSLFSLVDVTVPWPLIGRLWPAHDEALVCHWPVEQKGVHSGERDGWGCQQIRHGQVYNEDISEKRESVLLVFPFEKNNRWTLCCRHRLLLSE